MDNRDRVDEYIIGTETELCLRALLKQSVCPQSMLFVLPLCSVHVCDTSCIMRACAAAIVLVALPPHKLGHSLNMCIAVFISLVLLVCVFDVTMCA